MFPVSQHMFSHQCYGWSPLMSHLTFHGGDGSMGHHGILDLLTAPCGACCDAGLFFHWAACNGDGSHLGWMFFCFDDFDLLFVDVCCLGCLWIFFSETGKKHVLYRVATLSSLTLRPTSYDKATLFKNPPFLWPKRMIRTKDDPDTWNKWVTRGLIRTCWQGISHLHKLTASEVA